MVGIESSFGEAIDPLPKPLSGYFEAILACISTLVARFKGYVNQAGMYSPRFYRIRSKREIKQTDRWVNEQ